MKFITLRSLARRTGATCLIESGTYLGVTSARCSRAFNRVLTVELDPQLANLATSFLNRFDNVEVFQGDAINILPKLIARDDASRAVVFLDGHFSGGNTALGDVPEPAIMELEILANYRERICGIIIDDFRLFGVELGFPKKSDLIVAVESYFPFPDFELNVHADQLIVERRRPRSKNCFPERRALIAATVGPSNKGVRLLRAITSSIILH